MGREPWERLWSSERLEAGLERLLSGKFGLSGREAMRTTDILRKERVGR